MLDVLLLVLVPLAVPVLDVPDAFPVCVPVSLAVLVPVAVGADVTAASVFFAVSVFDASVFDASVFAASVFAASVVDVAIFEALANKNDDDKITLESDSYLPAFLRGGHGARYHPAATAMQQRTSPVRATYTAN